MSILNKEFPLTTEPDHRAQLHNRYGVYMIKSILPGDGRFYIGSTEKMGFHKRKIKHMTLLKKNKNANIPLQEFFNENGSKHLRFIVMEECDPEEAMNFEQKYIDLFDATNNGFNLYPRADSALGYNHSFQTKQKMRENMRIKMNTPEMKEKLSEVMRIKLNTPEVKEKLSEAARNRWKSTEYRKKLTDAFKGKKKSEEARQNMKAAWIKRKQKQVSPA